MKHISLTILRRLRQPRHDSHKGDNGVLYIVAGSKQYHGALWYVVETAAHFVDLIYVETDPSNAVVVRALKKLHPAIILVSPKQRTHYLSKSDCLLLGPGLGKGLVKSLVKSLVKTLCTHPQRPAKVVIDADALYYLRPEWMTNDMVITPHAEEYKTMFGGLFNNITPVAASKQVPCVIVRKGARDEICQNGKCRYNTVGNVGLTKGGTGDTLAGLIAGLACTNPVWTATQVSTLLIGLAAEDLAKTQGPHFTTQELIYQIPHTLQQWQHTSAKVHQNPRRP